jgi:hypothetical protein
VTAQLVAVVTFVAAALLVASGLAKVVRPLPTARAMYAAGLPGHAWFARAIGVAEIVVGTWFLTAPSTIAAVALALLFGAFAGFVAFLLLARPGAASCGCAGATDVPPSRIHLALNLVAAGAAVAAAIDPPQSLIATTTSLGAASIPFLVGLVTAAGLAVAAVTDLPPALASYRRPDGHPVESDASRHVRADAALAAAHVGPGHPSLWPGTSPGDAASHLPPTEPDA